MQCKPSLGLARALSGLMGSAAPSEEATAPTGTAARSHGRVLRVRATRNRFRHVRLERVVISPVAPARSRCEERETGGRILTYDAANGVLAVAWR